MDAIVQPSSRKWVSGIKKIKQDFDDLAEEVMKLDKTVLVSEISLRIAEKTAEAESLKEMYTSIITREQSMIPLAIQYSETSIPEDSGAESQSQVSQESDSQPGTSRAAIERDNASKLRKSISTSAENFMNPNQIARVVCEAAGGDKCFTIKRKKPQGTRKRGRKKKDSGLGSGGEEPQENEQPEDWGDSGGETSDDDANLSNISDDDESRRENQIELFRTDNYDDKETMEEMDGIHNPDLKADEYVFHLESDEDEIIHEDCSSDEDGQRFNPALMMPAVKVSPPSVVGEVKVVSTESTHGPASSKVRGDFYDDAMEVDFNAVPDAIPGPSKMKLPQDEGRHSQQQSQGQPPSSENMQSAEDAPQAPTANENVTHPHSPSRFKKFMNRAFEAKKSDEIARRPATIAALSKALNCLDTVPSDEKLNEIAKIINPLRPTTRGGAFKEKPVVRGASMPPLVPPFNKEAMSNVQSLDVFMTHSEDPSGFQWRSNNVQQQINYDMLNIAFKNRMAVQQNDYKTMDRSLLVDKANDVLIEISVFKPNDPDDILPDDVKIYQEPKLAYRVEVLGRFTIENFMDSIVCTLDLISTQEVEHPDRYIEKEEHMLKNKRLAKMMVIEDTIYAKDDDDIDFIERINAWTNTKIRKPIGPFTRGDVNTKFEDLKLRFGYPYLYVHLNNCEHIVVFNKARMIEPTDEHRLECYPKISKSTYMKNIYCRVDNEHTARWAVVNYADFPENPMFVCTKCLKEFCYTTKSKGTKRGKFQLYPFRQLSNLL